MDCGARPACNLLAVEIDRLADAGVLARDHGKGRRVEAHVDGEQGRSRIRGVEADHRGQVDPAELIHAPGDRDRDIGGALSGIDCVHGHPLLLEVSLVLRDEERCVGALNDPIHHDLDILRFSAGGHNR